MDRVVFTCDDRDFEGTLQLARENGAGVEIQTFAYPDALEHGLDGRVAHYREQLNGFSGDRTVHGAFMDMASASPDPRIVAVTEDRYQQNIRIAQALGAHLIVFHLNYLTNIRTDEYRRSWTEVQAAFWQRMGKRAADSGLTVALENMWEWEPSLIGDVIRQVDRPNVKACLDVAHVYLYSTIPFKDWLAALGDDIVYVHLNNNSGQDDQHRALDDGVIDYAAVLADLRGLPQAPILSLEITGVEPVRRSLRMLNLPSNPIPSR